MLTETEPFMLWKQIIALWGSAGRDIQLLYKGLSKVAKAAFTRAFKAMTLGGAEDNRTELVGTRIEWKPGFGTVVIKKVKRAHKVFHPFAWREKLDELRALLPVFEQVQGSRTKNMGCKAKDGKPGISARYRVDRKALLELTGDDDPIISVVQEGRGGWEIIRGHQVRKPEPGTHEIRIHLRFLSGKMITTIISVKDGKAVRYQAEPKNSGYWFSQIKDRIAEFVKFGSPYELDSPCLLSEAELEELKGLIVAEKAMKYLEISKTSKGQARRGTRETVNQEKFSEADMFRDARAAKAIQKRTNRKPQEGIGEYAGGWDADPEMDIEDETPTWPSKQDRALGYEHPARHFRLSLFSKKEPIPDPETGEERWEWNFESGPIILDKANMSIRKMVSPKSKYPKWEIQDVRGLKERIYQELEHGDLLFWAESYKGDNGYTFQDKKRTGLRLPSQWHNWRPKVRKPQLPCRQCGHIIWRMDPHAEVCDYCGSEGFPRNWVNVLIPAWRLAQYCTYDKGTTHIQVRLFGRAVGMVIQEAARRGVNITRPQIEMDYRPTFRPESEWYTKEVIKEEPDELPKVAAAVGFGRFLFGPDWVTTPREVVEPKILDPRAKLGRPHTTQVLMTRPPKSHSLHKEQGTMKLDGPTPPGFRWVPWFGILIKS